MDQMGPLLHMTDGVFAGLIEQDLQEDPYSEGACRLMPTLTSTAVHDSLPAVKEAYLWSGATPCAQHAV